MARRRIQPNDAGNVGIGTDSPTTTLDVVGTVKAQNVNGIALSLGNTGNQAIRDQTGSSTGMYFDVSTGGASHGTFIWRSSNAYTERMRNRRNQMLTACDWRVVADAPWDVSPWMEYRQALRDLPDSTTDPRMAAWPEEPA